MGETYAKITKAFNGCREGSFVTERFNKGDVVDGRIAEVAIENEWGEKATKAVFEKANKADEDDGGGGDGGAGEGADKG